VVAVPQTFEAGQIVQLARQINPKIAVTARAHSDSAVKFLADKGADHVIMGEHEIARGMADCISANAQRRL